MFKLKDGFIIREIGNQIMAVPVGKQTSEIHGMIALSESGKLLWERLKTGASVEELAAVLLENYDVEKEVAEADADKFIKALAEQGALL
ncbi:MAG: PqqD family protein [Clostridia bacterium]|nr:PqqD family protein [Clostridia bacterium]